MDFIWYRLEHFIMRRSLIKLLHLKPKCRGIIVRMTGGSLGQFYMTYLMIFGEV